MRPARPATVSHARRLLLAAAGAALAGCAGTPARRTLGMGTGAAGGTFAEYGPGIGRLVADLTGIELVMRATAGSTENARLLESGALPLALVNMGPAYEAWNGLEAWTGGRPMRNLRALVPMYETPFHVVAAELAGIRSLRDMAGRTVGAGPAGGPAELVLRALLKELGVEANLVAGTPGALAKRLIEGTVDAFWFGGGAPLPAFEEAIAGIRSTLLGLAPDEIRVALKRFPYMAATTLPAGTYAGQTAAIPTIGLWNFIVAGRALADADAYAITRAVLDHPGRMKDVHPAAAGTLARNAAANAFLPFHPGALRYYRERGIALAAPPPEDAAP